MEVSSDIMDLCHQLMEMDGCAICNAGTAASSNGLEIRAPGSFSVFAEQVLLTVESKLAFQKR